MKSVIAVLLTGILLGGFSLGLHAGEHPSEHPSEEHPTEGHKKHKKKSKHHAKITKKDLAKAIKSYVKKDSALKGGYYLVYDEKKDNVLKLKLDKVHKDRLAKVSEDVYFVCADFKTPDGQTYDIDIFMKGHKADSLQVTEVSVHKENGEARYGWVEKDGIWSKKEK